MDRFPTWPVATLSLIAGFAVADVTGVRPLGGIVLFAGGLWCGLAWLKLRGWLIAIPLAVFYLAAFAVSHTLGDQIGAWPSVFTVSAATGLAAWVAADRRRAVDVDSVV